MSPYKSLRRQHLGADDGTRGSIFSRCKLGSFQLRGAVKCQILEETGKALLGNCGGPPWEEHAGSIPVVFPVARSNCGTPSESGRKAAMKGEVVFRGVNLGRSTVTAPLSTVSLSVVSVSHDQPV